MADKTIKKGAGVHVTTSAICIALTFLGAFLFAFSYTTNYYTYGQMNSVLITVLLALAFAAEIAALILVKKNPDAAWPGLLTLLVTGLLAAAAMYIVGDRVEGIGNCIVTDYDSGHGGEEAIYMSLGGAVVLLVSMIYNIIGSFSKDGTAPAGKAKKFGLITSAAVLGVAAVVAVLSLVGVNLTSGTNIGPSGVNAATGEASSTKGAYTVSFNAVNENLDKVQDYQFQCANFAGFLVYDSRFTLDMKLDLDGAGNYKLTSDAYVVESGKRAVKDDGTGLGLISLTTAEGNYTVNKDGTVTTSVPTHAVYQMDTDTYSEQMKAAAGMAVEGHSEDGTYDSAEYPGVVAFVPETTWTLGEGNTITAYRKADPKGIYTVSFNAVNENLDKVQDYQFQCANFAGFLVYDSRFTLDMKLDLDGAGNYKLTSDAYVVESGKRAVKDDGTGLGLISLTTAEGNYTVNEDGTVTTSVPTHAVYQMDTDTYSEQMKAAAGMAVEGHSEDGTYDSTKYPGVLGFVPETTWSLGEGNAITAYRKADPKGTYTVSFNQLNENLDKVQDYQFLGSNFGGILRYDSRFYIDLKLDLDGAGKYNLYSEAYCIESGKRAEIGDDSGLGQNINLTAEGSYTVNEDGTVTTAQPEKAVFVMETDTYSVQIKGAVDMNVDGNDADGIYDSADHPSVLGFAPETIWTLSDGTIEAYVSANPVAEAEEAPAEEAPAAEKAPAVGVTIPSDDSGTEITFNSDGTYRFWFASYSVEDLGTYTYENGVLTLTDVNGVTYSAEGDPMHLHYGYSGAPDQLTGEYTIPADTFNFEVAPAAEAEAAPTGESVTIPSDDTGTEITFNPDGTYRFWFASYSVEDLGTYTYENGALTLTDVNGVTYSAEGDPMHLHYGYSGAPDQLTGEYTIPASTFDFAAMPAAEAEATTANAAELQGLTALSDDRGTSLTLFNDGTYRFWFAPYEVEDLGTWQIADGVLSVTDANGKEIAAEGTPYKLHYIYSMSDQLTGDYTIPVCIFPFAVSGTNVPSDDLATNITFFTDGSYIFSFDSYSIMDTGSWTFENGVLTLTDVNGVTYSAEGDPMHLHYGYSGAPDQLTGEYTIDPAIFA